MFCPQYVRFVKMLSCTEIFTVPWLTCIFTGHLGNIVVTRYSRVSPPLRMSKKSHSPNLLGSVINHPRRPRRVQLIMPLTRVKRAKKLCEFKKLTDERTKRWDLIRDIWRAGNAIRELSFQDSTDVEILPFFVTDWWRFYNGGPDN